MSPSAKWVVDRFEGESAVCQQAETKEMRDIPRSQLPEGIREGSVLRVDEDHWVIDEDDMKARSDRIRKKMDDLWE